MSSKAFFVAILLAMLAGSVFAQQAITSGTLSGRVEDPTGAVVPGATVEVHNCDTNQQWSATSDAQGAFRMMYLPAGGYILKASSAGFGTAESHITITVGQALEVPVRLAVANSNETVDVTSTVPVVELARTQVAETVTPAEVDNLPLNGRNYLDLALLVPSVSRTNTGVTQRFAETSAVPGTGISVAGQRNLANSFIVDGLSANDDAADLAGTFYSQEVIREFEVVTSGGIAEFGRAMGGAVNIVTHSGTNSYHGEGYGFLRNQRMDATNALATEKDPLTQAQYGATFGGPIRKDRTFFFANFEQMRQHAAGVVTITPDNMSAINATLDNFGYAGSLIATGEYPTSLKSSNFFGRIDQQLSKSTQLALRYSIYDVTSTNARNVGGLSAMSRGANLADRDQTIAANATSTVSNSLLNEARFQFTRSRLDAPVNDLVGPAINISGIANFGTATSSPTARNLDVYEGVDNISIQRGRHSFKTGSNLLWDRTLISFPGALQGVYTFSSLANFQAGKYVTFQQAFGVPDQFQSNPNVGAFAQDEWRVRRDLTLNLGVRYDMQFLTDAIHPDTNNIAPRIGIAWAPGADSKTVVRASYGIYYDRIPLRALSNALQRDGVQYKVAVLSFGAAGAPTFPNVLASYPTNLLTAITSVNPNIQDASSQQTSLQIERGLTSTTSVSAGYEYLRGEHIIMSHNVNVPSDPKAFNGGRPDATVGNNSQSDSLGDSYYNGLTVAFNKRASTWGSFRLSYNYAKSIDTAGNFFFSQPQDSFNIAAERGVSDNDQRHRLAVSGTLEAQRGTSLLSRAIAGFRMGYVFSYTSALPFNIQTGTDRNGDTNVNDRPVGVGRNTGRGFDFTSLDLRLSRVIPFTERLKLEAMAEGFNVLNRANYQVPNNIFGTGTTPRVGFGLATAAADPRQMQLGLRLTF
jgi:hypothetical protein